MNKQMLLNQINEASFTMDDAALFLDTHPNNTSAMETYRHATVMRKQALETYTRLYGPLLIDDANGSPWNWETEKWPWEGGC